MKRMKSIIETFSNTITLYCSLPDTDPGEIFSVKCWNNFLRIFTLIILPHRVIANIDHKIFVIFLILSKNSQCEVMRIERMSWCLSHLLIAC